jgi:hypothetical protein
MVCVALCPTFQLWTNKSILTKLGINIMPFDTTPNLGTILGYIDKYNVEVSLICTWTSTC